VTDASEAAGGLPETAIPWLQAPALGLRSACHAYGAIGLVAHPAGQAQPLRFRPRSGAEAHAL